VRAASIALVTVISVALASGAWAQKDKDDKPGRGQGQSQSHQGQGQGKGQGQDKAQGQGQGQGQAHGKAPGGGSVNVTVSANDRNTVYSYYRQEFAAGHCPPGLAKKNNGCLPPGQAKKLWVLGQPLPAGIAFYPLPGALLGRLSPAPAGYQYVRVANDILMMAVGTRLIVGALADLGSM
jgi:Ni/Co efflux regulator RcnB